MGSRHMSVSVCVLFTLCVDITRPLAHHFYVVLKREPLGSPGASAGQVCGRLFMSFFCAPRTASVVLLEKGR